MSLQTSPTSPASPNGPTLGADTVNTIPWSNPEREAAFKHWLTTIAPAHQLLPDSVRLASADASFRRYFRVDQTTGPSCIIMDAPPDKEDCAPFVKIAALMHEAQLKVPQVLAWDQTQGFMLLDDLGRQTMMQVINRDDARANQALYMQAVDALVAWQLASRPAVLLPYDEALMRRELELFPEWYLARHRGVTLTEPQRRTLDDAFKVIIEQCQAWPRVYVHRDFMPRNLMIPQLAPTLATACAALPPEGANFSRGGSSKNCQEPAPTAQLGVLDFQDAVYGPITYDIASLMRDAFLSWDEDFVLDITIRYWEKARQAGLPVGEDFGAFYRGVEWMGLQRHLKVAGIFARLTLRDGKPQYLADAPRFINYIRATTSRYRELKPLLRLIDSIEGTTDATGFAFGRI